MVLKPQLTARKYEEIARVRHAQTEKPTKIETIPLCTQLEIAEKLAAEYKNNSDELEREVQRRKGLIGTYAIHSQTIIVAEERRQNEDPFGAECIIDAEQESKSFSFGPHAIYIQRLVDEQGHFRRKYEAQCDMVWQLKVRAKEEKDHKIDDGNSIIGESSNPAFESSNNAEGTGGGVARA